MGLHLLKWTTGTSCELAAFPTFLGFHRSQETCKKFVKKFAEMWYWMSFGVRLLK